MALGPCEPTADVAGSGPCDRWAGDGYFRNAPSTCARPEASLTEPISQGTADRAGARVKRTADAAAQDVLATRVADRGLIVVFGATGAIGRRVVDEALRVGYRVRAFTRDAAKVPARRGLEVVEGDAADPEAVARAIAGTGAVVNAMGPTSNQRAEVDRTVVAIRNVLAGMDRHGVRRLVSLNGAAVTETGERKPVGARIAGAIVRLFAGNVVRAKQREYEEIAASDVEWTIVRPPRVTQAPAVGRAIASDRLHSRTVSEVDLAAFMVVEIDGREHVHAAPYISG